KPHVDQTLIRWRKISGYSANSVQLLSVAFFGASPDGACASWPTNILFKTASGMSVAIRASHMPRFRAMAVCHVSRETTLVVLTLHCAGHSAPGFDHAVSETVRCHRRWRRPRG